jgi:topoisomerase IV subunit B
MSQRDTYTASDIRVLEGLEPVKLRPGMYTRTDAPNHILQEVVDNAADEALAGYCKTITVSLYADGSAEVSDDGRGIPVDRHKESGKAAVELIFTKLHSGGKFDKGSSNAYAFSGGLHGVGVSVTNALSTRLECEVLKGGSLYRIIFENGGDLTVGVKKIGAAEGTGTRVRFWPDPKYFDTALFSQADIIRMLHAKAVLMPGLTCSLRIEKKEGWDASSWVYENGIRQYLEEQTSNLTEVLGPFHSGMFADESDPDFAAGEGAEWVLVASEEHATHRESYVNLIPTQEGGTHETGMRAGVFEAVNEFAEAHALLPKGVKLSSDDIWKHISYVLSAKLLDPQFQGQVKDKLTSREGHKLILRSVKAKLTPWLIEHIEQAKALCDLAVRNAQARMRQGQKVERKRTSGITLLPGKLSDCESSNPEDSELYLVEGDSAGGSAKLARNKVTQAILPLKGKPLNTWEIPTEDLFSNDEIHDIATAIGINPHGIDDPVDLSKLRYGKINVASDADVDGFHIQVLVICLFYKHFPKVLANGNVYIAKAPLYRVDVAAGGRSRPAKKLYLMDNEELLAAEDRLRKEGYRENQWRVGRFKGLGEMNPDELRDSTMNPDTRTLLQVCIPVGAEDETRGVLNKLLAKGEAASRRKWMEEHGHEVEL